MICSVRIQRRRNHNIAGAEDCLQAWESLELTADQKLYRLVFKYGVLPPLLLWTKQQKKQADQTAINTLVRMTRRMKNN